MSGLSVPVDFSGPVLDLDEDDDLEVFTKVRRTVLWLRCYVNRTLTLQYSVYT